MTDGVNLLNPSLRLRIVVLTGRRGTEI